MEYWLLIMVVTPATIAERAALRALAALGDQAGTDGSSQIADQRPARRSWDVVAGPLLKEFVHGDPPTALGKQGKEHALTVLALRLRLGPHQVIALPRLVLHDNLTRHFRDA